MECSAHRRRARGRARHGLPAPGGRHDRVRPWSSPARSTCSSCSGADEIDLSRTDAFVVYLGTHGDKGAHRADVILPGAAYTEKPGLYVNTEGRVQRGERAVFPKGEAKEDWTILRALSEVVGHKLPYDSLDQLRERLFADHPTFGQIDLAPGALTPASRSTGLGEAGELSDAPLRSPVERFHFTNPIARASVTMAECAALADGYRQAAE